MNRYNLSARLGFVLFLILAFSSAVMAQEKAKEALVLLKEGNKRFCTNRMQHQHQNLETVKDLTKGQDPFAVVISCSDSRVTPEIIFDQGLGDVFSIRTAGNVMADLEEGSIEYAAEHLGTQLIVVLGHTHCGAVKAFMDVKHGQDKGDDSHESLGHIQSIIDKLDSEEEECEVFKSAADDDTYNKAIKANVVHGVKQLKECDPFLSHMYKERKIAIVGAIYNIESGEVEFLEI